MNTPTPMYALLARDRASHEPQGFLGVNARTLEIEVVPLDQPHRARKFASVGEAMSWGVAISSRLFQMYPDPVGLTGCVEPAPHN
jgi:hypothetical protein